MRSAKTTQKTYGVMVREQEEAEARQPEKAAIAFIIQQCRIGYDVAKADHVNPSPKVIKRKIRVLKEALAIVRSSDHILLPQEKLPIPRGLLLSLGGDSLPNRAALFEEWNHDLDFDMNPLISARTPESDRQLLQQHRDWLLRVVAEVIEQAAQYFKTIPIRSGRPNSLTMVGPGICAFALANRFKAKTRKHRWQKVGEIVAQHFPEALKDDPNHPTDLRLWAYRLAKRYQKGLRSPWVTPLTWGMIERQYIDALKSSTLAKPQVQSTKPPCRSATKQRKTYSPSAKPLRDSRYPAKTYTTR